MITYVLDYTIGELVPYINWAYFYHAWQTAGESSRRQLRREAEAFLCEICGRYRAHALFLLAKAHSDGDDIVVESEVGERRLPMLRQQTGEPPFLCLSDFLPPAASQGLEHYARIGLFATSVDSGMERDFDGDPYRKMMAQLLADRLAEAAAEAMHEAVRKRYWGYAPGESLTMEDLHQERFQGIRPAVGYPSLPDASLNFVLDNILGLSQIGITLTENGAMRPHASVTGLMICHPKARYFAVGKIATDQLDDYARRRGLPAATLRRFLAASL